ncbi:MAG: hypothetical protein V7609_1459 [Verrucomicrobiota bacterium]
MKLADYTYLTDGRVDRVDYGNAMTSDPSYDPRGFVSSMQHKRTATGEVIASHSYTGDTRDRITSLRKGYNPTSNPLENGRGDRFRYDEEGQLVEGWYDAPDPGNSGAGNTRYDGFAYDALGNRTQNNYIASRGLTSFIRRDNGLNQYSSWSPSVIYHDDNYPGWGPAGNGVMMAEGWITASYNALNQPIAIWSPAYQGTDIAYFGYDPLGRCVKRWVGDSGDVYSNPATYFHYDGWNLLQEGSNAWGPARVYAHGNRIDEIVWSYNPFTGDQAYHHYDARGHCTLLTDSVGSILEQYEYDAFGQPYFYNAAGAATTVNGQPGSLFGNRFLFTGREWSSDLKLYDYRNRMYQPELGRFLQPDPKEFAADDYNLYRYCHNDPVNKSDPFGLEDDGHNIVIGILDGAAFGLGTAIRTGNNLDGPDVQSEAYQGGLRTGMVLGMATGSTEVRAVKTAYEVASQGGRHAGFLRTYVTKTLSELGKAVRSITKQIAKHEQKIQNPARFMPNFNELPSQQQKALVEKVWPNDIKRQQEQVEILKKLQEQKQK